MKNLIDEIDFKYIEKLSLNKCFELDLIPIKKEDFVYIICDNSKNNYIDRLNLVYGLPIKILEINEDEFLKLKHMIFLEINENVENIIIEEAINDRASDIHFEPSRGGVNIRFRIDGLLVRRYKISYEIYEKVISRIKNNSNLDITEKRKPQDGKMKFKLNNNEYNLRVSIIKTINGEKLVIRILREGLIKLDFRDLTNIEEQRKDLIRIVRKKEGLVIINGPTGSGKSTSLYSILESSKDDGINITSIEDPVEVSIDGINQIQLNRKVNLDFSNALRSVLRQDPDIVMIGEIRDSETAKMAIRASITGHKVYSTLHSISGREVFFRLKDLGIDEKFLREALVGIISQRLIKKLCDKCKQEETINFNGENIKCFKRVGCTKCSYTGYKGRILLSQIYKLDKTFSIEELEKDSNMLSNNKMKEMAYKHLINGDITYIDYIDFIEEEEDYNDQYKIL